ncbi:hypothetical protein GGF32_002083 [Allomyces javanicus]|nr:hypothetical protein GGF32_002083 [Allomyces javanicus]
MARATTLLVALLAVLTVLTASSSVALASPVPDGHDIDGDGDDSLRPVAEKATQKYCTNCYKKSVNGGMWCKKSQGCYYVGKDYHCPECPQNDPDPKKCKYPMSKPPSKSP